VAATFEQIITDLRNKIYHPVYFLCGEEPYFIDEISGFIEENVLDESEKEFNLTVLYGRETSIATVITYARQYPMMGNYHVVIVKEAQEIERNEGQKGEKVEDLALYIEKPLKSTILVVNYKYRELDKRKKFAKEIEKAGVLFQSDRLYDSKIPGWIDAFVVRSGYKIKPEATILLAEFLGNDLGKVVNETKKLFLNLPAGSTVTGELIESHIGISKDYNVFELQKALGDRNVFRANRIVNHFALNEKENHILKVIPMLYGFFIKVMVYHQLEDKSQNSAAAAMGVRPYFVKDYQAAARNYSMARLTGVITWLREYDMKAKGVDNVSATSGELLRELVFRILH
jgi:DNA polymerase-3 subunit delta